MLKHLLEIFHQRGMDKSRANASKVSRRVQQIEPQFQEKFPFASQNSTLHMPSFFKWRQELSSRHPAPIIKRRCSLSVWPVRITPQKKEEPHCNQSRANASSRSSRPDALLGSFTGKKREEGGSRSCSSRRSGSRLCRALVSSSTPIHSLQRGIVGSWLDLTMRVRYVATSSFFRSISMTSCIVYGVANPWVMIACLSPGLEDPDSL